VATVAACLAIGAQAPTAAAQGADPSAEDIVNKVQGYYSGIDDFEASFVQTTSHKMFAGRLERSYGKVMFRKGGLMRWEYTRPDRKLFIYDGATLWIYEPEVPQIFKGSADAERLRRALAFLTGEGKIMDEYKVAKLDAKRYRFSEGVVLKLVPKSAGSPFKHVELYVDATTHRVVRSVVVDHEGNRNRLDLNAPATNGGLPNSLFTFTPPPDVPVISAQQ
jgi:outer membrane lipoprotein carrier protein